MTTREVVLCFSVFVLVSCGYPPIGDEVIPGSVLLPATRRGRYLANIVRRQAVDGTGIKFNKDADRMNAEAKKKVDVLSEELLPYIIAEQERRTTLYKRVMTAIQNGEKGVTIAEIRNKPPLIIRKGLMFRCPANRAPKEPDGSGVIMCEQDVEPTPVMFDSCLSAEDKELYVAENKYFFCNRHRTEGPDLPRNGSTVIGCAPTERTSLNYTNSKCALEDTDDVVVHYRYYPDRTYKFVTELDPDREVCDNWNPCQIGYIYSLPSADQAVQANEFWRDAIAEDFLAEYVPVSLIRSPTSSYEITKRFRVPRGYKFDSIWTVSRPIESRDRNHKFQGPVKLMSLQDTPTGQWAVLSMKLEHFEKIRYGPYYALFSHEGGKGNKTSQIAQLEETDIEIETKSLMVMPGMVKDPEIIQYRCEQCRLQGIMVRSDDGRVYNLESARWSTVDGNDGRVQVIIAGAKPKDIGTYYMRFLGESGNEEMVQCLRLTAPAKVLKAPQFRHSATAGEKVEHTITYSCEECQVTDVTCNGESTLQSGKVSILPGVKMISFNIASFENSDACVYMGLLKQNNDIYSKALAVIETVKVEPTTVTTPAQNEPFEATVDAKCEGSDGKCQVSKVSVNGIALDPGPTRRMDNSPAVYYRVGQNTITIYMSAFDVAYEGIFQAVFEVNGESITKTILEIKGEGDAEVEAETTTAAAEDSTAAESAAADDATTADPTAAADDAATADPAAAADDATTTDPAPAADGDSTADPGSTAAAEEVATEATEAPPAE